MVQRCAGPDPGWEDECDEWNADRLAYRLDRNRQMAARFMHYAPDQEATMASTGTEAVLFEDQDGDGIAEFLVDGPAVLRSGADVDFEIRKTGDFTGVMHATPASGGSEFSVHAEDLVPVTAAHPEVTREMVAQDDMGLQEVFADSTGCTGGAPDPDTCPLLKRFFTLIDRHEDFYQTYTSLRPDSSSISAQPSPLVACSVTLAAAHEWDSAGTPSGGTAGFIFLMRIPYRQILASTDSTVATLDPPPDVTTIADLYAGEELDMTRVWLDIASLSSNLFESEHEISKFGAVPAEQIEGILVVRRPAAMDDDGGDQ
jgi:hypothetical protein